MLIVKTGRAVDSVRATSGDFEHWITRGMRRDLSEDVASQNKMLDHRGEENPVRDEKAMALYRKHLISTRVLTSMSPCFEVLEVNYRDILQHPQALAERVNRFLGRRLDTRQMASAVDPSLYRNRAENRAKPEDEE